MQPEQLLPFPWDAGERAKAEAKKVSKEEAKVRFERLMKHRSESSTMFDR
jgi:hypothetical protein